MVIGKGSAERNLSPDEVRSIVAEAVESAHVNGKRVLIIIPDGTRTMPMPAMFGLFQELLRPRVKALDYLVALGTHALMTDAQLTKLVGRPVVNEMAGDTHVFNHHWEKPDAFVHLGAIPASEIRGLTRGMMARDVPVGLNKLILDYDQIFICGPVFPHEVVGFSGGNKYFFPGIASPEIINFTHWLGALITNFEVIGSGYTPVRAVIDRAASMIPRPTSCFALVVAHEDAANEIEILASGVKTPAEKSAVMSELKLRPPKSPKISASAGSVAGLYFGAAQEAWEAASKLSAKKHIVYVEKPFRRVLSVMPEMYRDLWTAGKGMYKIEPAVADGGEVVIYSPHLTEISYSYGNVLREIGYHCRDYFLKQWDRFKDYPGGVLAHSTHVKGLGTYDATTGIETPRIRVTLATGIPEDVCDAINLGYLDPASVRVDEWRGREGEGVMVAPRAGEVLYRLRSDPHKVERDRSLAFSRR
ncbi:MAG TPA: lactate racemase domain-containing protein [Candidatus Acidoferrum sp.]|nr:lactate racemase domain-containing protein [Candidatus Acidoferrum sp.]